MNLHEYQSKEILASYGVRIQRGFVANNVEEAVAAADKLKELMSDKSFADKIMKDDKEAVKLFNDLQAARFGDRNNG